MNFASRESREEFRHISFNQDGTHFVVLTNDEFHVIQVDGLVKRYSRKAKEIDIVEMVYNTNFVGYVENKKFRIFDAKKKEDICEIPDGREITGIRFTERYFVIIFADEADIYDRNHLEKKYWTVKTAKKNTEGICCTSLNNDMFAVPAPKIGYVNICDLKDRTEKTVFCHANIIQCLAMSHDGKIVATASDNARNIKLVDCENGRVIKSVRRGRSIQTMYSINFSSNSKYLCCYSSSGTLHQFSVDGKGENRTATLSGLSYIGISFLGSEWSKNETKLKPGDCGSCVFKMNSDEIVYVLTKSGSFTTVDMSKKQEKEKFKTVSLRDIVVKTIDPAPDPAKFPNRVTVLLDIRDGCHLPRLPKRKYLVPKTLKIIEFGYSIATKLSLEDISLKFYVGDKMEYCREIEATMGGVYNKFKSSDNYLRMEYCD